MNDKPEALRLAQELDAYHTRSCHKEAAAELRRLHEESDLLASAADKLRMLYREERTELLLQRDQATAQRDALLEALKDMLNAESGYPYGGMSESEISAIRKARAAIKAVEEMK